MTTKDAIDERLEQLRDEIDYVPDFEAVEALRSVEFCLRVLLEEVRNLRSQPSQEPDR